MSRHESTPPRETTWPIDNPWPLLIGGLALALLALFLRNLTAGPWIPIRVVLLVSGLIAAGGAVSVCLSSTAWDVDSRFRAAGILALAGLAALIGYPAMDADWDTARLVLVVLVGLALAGAVLVLLPQTLRRIVLSLLMLYHFGGILMAATSVPPPNGPPPWITQQLWTRIYRPYLQFMYLNNAYHFYSPEPGPPTLLWFRIEYEQGPARWIEVPNRADFRTKLEFQRRLAMTESTNQIQTLTPVNFEEKWKIRLLGDTPENLEAQRNEGKPLRWDNIRREVRHRPLNEVVQSVAAGDFKNLIIPPIHPYVTTPPLQYREPTPYSKKMTASYARHVARNYPSEEVPTSKVVGVKVYRVIHDMLHAAEFAHGVNPFKLTKYRAFYHGEFDRDGNLLDPEDPFLYWAIPIEEVAKDGQSILNPDGTPRPPEDLKIINYVTEHGNEIRTRRKPAEK